MENKIFTYLSSSFTIRRVAAVVIALAAFQPTLSYAGGRVIGNGGGGLIRHGKVLTFGSALIPLHPVGSLKEIPGLSQAVEGIKSLDIPDDLKGKFLTAVYPTPERQYFLIQPSEVSRETYGRLEKEFKQAAPTLDVGKNPKFTLLAITSKTDTYLLPNFFKVEDQIGEAAILFHEALFALNPDFTEHDVRNLEIAFEKFLRGKNDVDIYYDIALYITPENDSIVISAYLNHDLNHGALSGFVRKTDGGPVVALPLLLGDALTPGIIPRKLLRHSKGELPVPDLAGASVVLDVDKARWASYLQGLMQHYPSSLFLQFLAQSSAQLDFLLAIGYCEGQASIPIASLLVDRPVDLTLDTDIAAIFAGDSCLPGYGVGCGSANGNHFRGYKSSDVGTAGCPTSISLALPQSWSGNQSQFDIRDDVKHRLFLDEKKVDVQLEN